MNGLFCRTTAQNNEEYKKVLKTRMNIMVIIGMIGIITLVIGLLAQYKWNAAIDYRMMGMYTGAGTALIAVAIVLWVKNKLLLADEEKLKENRLNNSDERIQEISNKAFRIATIVLLIVLYAIGLIGGLFYPILVKVLLSTVLAFVVAYRIAFKIYDKRM